MDLLAGETLLYEGRPRKGPPWHRNELVLLLAQWIVLWPTMLLIWTTQGNQLITWHAAYGLFTRLSLTNPFAWLPLMIGVCLYFRAHWNSQTYLITNQRVLIDTGVFRRNRQKFVRKGNESARMRRGGSLILEGLRLQPVHFPGLDQADLESIQHALAQPNEPGAAD